MELLGTYRNGNYKVSIYEDGTKVRTTKDDEFKADFAENIDLKLTNRCTGAGCAYCHEGSGPSGRHADIMNLSFINTLHPWTELALGGGNILEHPDLIPFLRKLREKNVIANITVNQVHFMKTQALLKRLVNEGLVYGIGVSMREPSDSFIKLVKEYKNAVIHVINGIVSTDDLKKLYDNDLAVLILGYKSLRRGSEYIDANGLKVTAEQKELYDLLPEAVNHFRVLSFDNLAIKQLNVRRLLSDKEWEKFYMGDDGSATFYIDAVEKKFARSSTAPEDERYDLLENAEEMFKIIRRKYGNR